MSAAIPVSIWGGGGLFVLKRDCVCGGGSHGVPCVCADPSHRASLPLQGLDTPQQARIDRETQGEGKGSVDKVKAWTTL